MKGRENMTKQEVIELVKSGRLRGFLTPEAAKYAINIEEMGTYTGIVLVNPDMKEAAYPVFNLDRAMEKLQYIDTPEETAEILAGTINRFLQTAPKSSDININGLREKLSNYNAAKPYIFMDAVSHKYNNDRAVIHEINGMKFVPKIMISDEERMRAVSPVPKDWLIEQGISEDRLIDDAISNTANITHSAQIAQDKRDYNVTARGTIPKVLKDKKLAKAIEEKIVDKGYSPEAAIETMVRSGEMDKYEESVCVKTVYNSIDKGFFSKITNKDLPVKRNKNKKDYKKIHRIKKACAGTSIEDRPEDILEREEFGHMEMDSVIGKREKGSTLLTIIERKTRNIIVKKQPDKTSKSVVETLDELERELGDVFYKLFKTITVDNGTEFADCAGIERSCVYPGRKRTKVYYCHPYASCERGSNENGNRMIRRKIPKGTSINGYSKEEIQQIEDWVNEYPRRMFGYRSSNDLYKEEMRYLI